MRKLTNHIVEGDSANHQLTIEVMDEPGQGGANYRYQISDVLLDLDEQGRCKKILGLVDFQNGPITEVGVNGVTHEALMAIVIDRLRSFQAGPYACESNQKAMDYAMLSLDFLKDRTRARIARGVEGTNQK